MSIAVDLVHMAHQNTADAFILISGDEDMTRAVKVAKDQLCNVYLAFAASSADGLYVSDRLSTEADTAINLIGEGDILQQCLLE